MLMVCGGSVVLEASVKFGIVDYLFTDVEFGAVDY